MSGKPNNFSRDQAIALSLSTGSVVGGDLGGSTPDPVVVGIQGIPVCTTPPAVGEALIFDGTQYCPDTPGSTGTGMVPYYIEPATTFTVPLYKQALFKDTIEVDGILVVLGRLLGVD